MVYIGITCQICSVGSDHQHSLVDADAFPSYLRHSRLHRDMVIWLAKEVFSKLAKHLCNLARQCAGVSGRLRSSRSTPSGGSPSSVATIPCKSQPPILNSKASTNNNLHTSLQLYHLKASFYLPLLIEWKSTEIQVSVPLLDISSTTSFSQPSISKVVNKNYKRRRKRMKEQKPDIEIKMSPHKPNKSYVHYTSEDEDMIVYDVEDEHFKHHLDTGYSHLITSRKYQKKYVKMTEITAFNTV
ncbi:hypothetical protein TNCV_3705341 [Trichonephila clavipes]|nr:hypothetical protein TNCV_3705341 [Trichonephila clavipes]